MSLGLGVDIGSLFTKAVVMRDGELVASLIAETTGNVSEEIAGLIGKTLEDAGVAASDLDASAITGRGADAWQEAEYKYDDVSCIAAALKHIMPEVGMSLEIGGQSITALLLDGEGGIIDFMRNDKCASGSGKFLEVMSAAVGVSIEQLDEVVTRSTKKVPISSQCGVFVESEVITHVNEGEAVPDIVAGLCESVAKIIISQALKFGMLEDYTLTGGVAALKAVTGRATPRINGNYREFPYDPRLVCAMGAALMAVAE
ncbi:MAG: hypothetical protein CVU59_11185 [Deltaproteobacteria bacterium HGW-Deltaproteobacteria-17]|nr:MAG: hypothetical protein CVU59_11185 [Deltaproteobacteria bacterium HGW-Deltaproteobacteria-17]